ncbi:glycosyltransferase family 4 protein [Streptomyces aidingensis]|uniref:D-inositol 3-phosphate glycosyltransferase n=1 Tax=Streptomyces aidingensis TaxID=910347 RepID=A0A1I1V4J4_9ACTN|nr:glycosyltransferase family 4 protein [Streptomyces aidingensis]SFD77957.1 Glycosyltransferase involved in cell wall bisynthesis [Streptomyces aidingensis]
MRIAHVAPLWESVPPRGYGAIETLVAELSAVQVLDGHDVTVFASGDSKVAGNLHSAGAPALHEAPGIAEPEIYRMLQLLDVRDRADEFDVIHSHVHANTGCLAIPALYGLRSPVLHTVHCYFNEDNTRLFRRFATERYVAISDSQRSRLPELNFLGTIHHGIAVEAFPFAAEPVGANPYLVFLGRIRPEKGVHIAIEAARLAGLPLKIAGRIKHSDRTYFEHEVQPHLDGKRVSFLGELDFPRKTSLLAGAVGTLITSRIPEPFGLVAIESMACGTPVVSLRTGAAAELVNDGVTGYLADSIEELAAGIRRLPMIDRASCRQHVAARFSIRRMTDGYERTYRTLTRS